MLPHVARKVQWYVHCLNIGMCRYKMLRTAEVNMWAREINGSEAKERRPNERQQQHYPHDTTTIKKDPNFG